MVNPDYFQESPSLFDIFVNAQYRKAKLSDESRRGELDNAMKEICGVYTLLAKYVPARVAIMCTACIV